MTYGPETYEELSCQELVELVTDYLEGAMPEGLRLRFERHVAECSGCRTYLEQMRLTIRATGTLTVEAVTPEAEEALLEAFRGFRR
jgi:predicted anti-sigma-YlaC factor YlaD